MCVCVCVCVCVCKSGTQSSAQVSHCSLLFFFLLCAHASLGQSTLFIGSPSNSVILNFNNPPAGAASARFNFTLLSFQQNGTSFNRATNVTTSIYYRTGLSQLLVAPANIVQANSQKYLVTLPITDPSLAHCGDTLSGPDATYAQTRCVLRYVYDASASGQNSRVSCADVVVRPRNGGEALVSVRVGLASGDVPVSAATALRRLLTSAWATQTALRIDVFQTPSQIAAGDGDQSAQQIRPADSPSPIVVDGASYSMNFVFSDTTTFTANQLASNFLALGNAKLSLMFDRQCFLHTRTCSKQAHTRSRSSEKQSEAHCSMLLSVPSFSVRATNLAQR